MSGYKNKVNGFTLLEMLLVMVIVSIIIFASVGYVQQKAENIRIDRASSQMQQILNAGLAYYVDHSTWPPSGPLYNSGLQGTYLPPKNVTFNNPWGQQFYVYSNSPTSGLAQLFYVYTAVTQAANTNSGSAAAAANAIAGLLPSAYTTGQNGAPPPAGTPCEANSTSCNVVAAVNIPGQNLNNARAINFAGVYHPNGCIPVPDCPVDSQGSAMKPQVTLVPVSVSGYLDDGTGNVYPLSSFTAFVSGDYAANPAPCPNTQGSSGCGQISGTPAANYWRACIQIMTPAGVSKIANTTNVTMAAFTRCATPSEASGTQFIVY